MSDERGDPYKIARENGWVIIQSRADHLQLDIDVPFGEKPVLSEEQQKIQSVIRQRLGLEYELRVKSPGGNTHVYIKIPREWQNELTYGDRIALQTLLGSDKLAEALSLTRYVTGGYPHLMFETPETASVVNGWLA